MKIREARMEDTAAIAQVHVDTWCTVYRAIIPADFLANLSYQQRENGWRQILSKSATTGTVMYVAETETGQVIGFVCGGPERTGDPTYNGEIQALYILATYQGQGVGRSLVQSVVSRLCQQGLRSMLVWVLADNPACRFYEVMGGQKVYEKQIEIGGAVLNEVAYGWADPTPFRIQGNLEADD